MNNILQTKNLIIILILILLIAGGIFWYFRETSTVTEENGESRGFFSSLFPDVADNSPNTENPPSLDPNNSGNLPNPESVSNNKIVSERISGAVFYKKNQNDEGKIRYFERATGHVFEIDTDGENKNRLSNTTIPGVFEAIWSPSGDTAILKYLVENDLRILSAKITASSTLGTFLPSNIKDIVFSPKGERMAYVLPSGEETLIVSATPDNKSQRILYRTTFSSWKIFWPADNTIYLLTKPSAQMDGFLYRLNLATGAIDRIIGPRLGLNISTDGKSIYFAEMGGDRIYQTSLLNLSSREITSTALRTLPDKCVWSKIDARILFCGLDPSLAFSDFPDDWLKGKVSFSDMVLKINFKDLTASTYKIERGLDVSYPFLSADESKLFFTNKTDGSLWAVDLK